MIDLAPHMAATVARYEAWARACQAGRCVYRDLSASDVRPPMPPHGFETCPGYAGMLHLEHGLAVMRVRNCATHTAWWARRRAYLRTQRERERAPSSARPGWRRDPEPSGEETP